MKNGSSKNKGKAWIPQSVGSLIEGTGISFIVSPVLYWSSKLYNGVEMNTHNRCTHQEVHYYNPTQNPWIFQINSHDDSVAAFLGCMHPTTCKSLVSVRKHYISLFCFFFYTLQCKELL